MLHITATFIILFNQKLYILNYNTSPEGMYMDNFPKSKYYLVRIFYKVPHPFLIWPLMLTVIYLVGDYLTYSSFEKESVLLLISNTFFSISALFLTVIIYERNIVAIQDWFNKYETVNTDNGGAIGKLNEIHEKLFSQALLVFPVLVVLIRRLIANKLINTKSTTEEILINNGLATNEIVNNEILKQNILGGIVNDTITQFLIASLILSSIGIIICIYVTSSFGVETKCLFEIKIAYEGLYVNIVKNTAMIGIELGVFCSAVIIWAHVYSYEDLGTLCNILIIGSIPLIFLIGVVGIRNGINSSKNNMVLKLSSEMEKYDILECGRSQSLANKDLMASVYDSISKKVKDTMKINPWMLDVKSLTDIGFTLIISTTIKYILRACKELK